MQSGEAEPVRTMRRASVALAVCRLYCSMNVLDVIQSFAMILLLISDVAALSKFGSGIGLLRLFLRFDRPGRKDHWLVLDL